MAKRGKRLNRSRGGDIVMFCILAFFACFMALPMIFAIGSSFKPWSELFTFPPTLLPRRWTLNNYIDLFQVMSSSWVPFTRYFFNTVFITVIGTAGHIIVSSLCAYPLALYRFPGSKFMLAVVRLALMFNPTVLAIPTYFILSSMKLVDTYWAILFPAFGGALGLYLMSSFMGQIPTSIVEAARIDGAGHWRVFRTIVMPQVKSAWLTLIIFQVQALWNMGVGSTNTGNVVYSEQLKTITAVLQNITQGGIARQGIGAAITVLMLSVPIAVFIITQSNIIETMATSGLKD